MKPLDTAAPTCSAVVVMSLSAALSGCYYYVPYGYMPGGEVATQQYLFTVPDTAASGEASGATNYIAAATPVFVEPAYYPVAYPYYGWPWWGPSVSLSFGYWGGCCYGGGHHGYWGHGGWGGHGNWGHGNGGGWTGHGYRWHGGGGGDGGWSGGGHYWGGGARHGSVH